jgi:hypothetical protein
MRDTPRHARLALAESPERAFAGDGFQISGRALEYGLVPAGRMLEWSSDSSTSRSAQRYACAPAIALGSSVKAELVILRCEVTIFRRGSARPCEYWEPSAGRDPHAVALNARHLQRRGESQAALAGNVRRMKSAKCGAVNAISPWRGL